MRLIEAEGVRDFHRAGEKFHAFLRYPWTVRALLVFLIALTLPAADRQVAITIDDLPRGGDALQPCAGDLAAFTRRFLQPLRDARVPFSGFVNEARCRPRLDDRGLAAILRQWKDAGAELGNHTASHPNYHSTPREEFFAGIEEGERVTRRVTGAPVRYFRHPFLHTGKTLSDKQALEKWLREHGYVVAPITIDNADYIYAALYARAKDAAGARRIQADYLRYMEEVFAFYEQRSREVLGREIAQTLLIHASQLNADSLPDLIAMLRRRSYRIVSLTEALRDPLYAEPETYVGDKGISWIHRWGLTKGMPIVWEPDPPAWVNEAYRTMPR